MADIRAILERERAALLSEIKTLANRLDASGVLVVSGRLQAIEDLLLGYRQMDARGISFLDKSGGNIYTTDEISSQRPSFNVPGRGHGVEIRGAFLERAHALGLALRPMRGSIFRGPMDTRVGVAVATEKQPNKWFLGLPERGFDAAVLLCHGKNETTVDICLPPAFVSEFGPRLSTSRGQTKFNVVLRAGRYSLLIPGEGAVDVQPYVGAVKGLVG